MDSQTIAVVGLVVGSAGLVLSVFNTARQVRRDRARDQPRLVVSATVALRRDDAHPFALVIRVANAGFRQVQVVGVRFLLDPERWGVAGGGALTMEQLPPGTPLPVMISENESIALEFDPQHFGESRGIHRAQVEDALGNRFYADVPQMSEDG